MSSTEGQRDPAPAVTRALRILNVLAESPEPVSLSELARVIGAAKSSTSNLCVVLQEGGMVLRTPRGYQLGRRTLELGGAYASRFNQVREFYGFCLASPLLRREVVHIAMLDGTDVLYLARHEGSGAFRLSAAIGSRFPAAPTAVGNALLTTLSDAEIAARFTDTTHFPRRTERSVRDLPGLLTKIRTTRARGFALDESEVFPGITGLAVVLPPWAHGEPALALGTSVAADEANPRDIGALLAELRAGVGQLANPLFDAQIGAV